MQLIARIYFGDFVGSLDFLPIGQPRRIHSPGRFFFSFKKNSCFDRWAVPAHVSVEASYLGQVPDELE
jgi:hypothetical protein